jgi:hypothetical protein
MDDLPAGSSRDAVAGRSTAHETHAEEACGGAVKSYRAAIRAHFVWVSGLI